MSAVHPVSANATQVLKGRYWTNNGGQPPHFDNFALECPRTEQEHYPERTGIGPRLERYCRSSGSKNASRSCPAGSVADAGLRWCGGRRYQPNGGSQMSKAAKKSSSASTVPSLPTVPHGRLMAIPRAGAALRARRRRKKKERSGLQSACDELTDKRCIHHR